MALILGIIASSIQKTAPGAYESIATFNVTSTTSSITFSSIPSTYKQLQIRYSARNTNSGITDLNMTFNGDTGGNYNKLWVFTFDGGGPYTSTSFNSSGVSLGYTYGNDSGVFNAGVVDIIDPASTSKAKTFHYLTGNEKVSTGTTTMVSGSGHWNNTVNAINSITLAASNFAANSRIALYGIKGE